MLTPAGGDISFVCIILADQFSGQVERSALCLYVCLWILTSNNVTFDWIFGFVVHLDRVQVMYVNQSYRSKFRVTEEQNTQFSAIWSAYYIRRFCQMIVATLIEGFESLNHAILCSSSLWDT